MTASDNALDLVAMRIQEGILIFDLEPAMDFILLVQALLHCGGQWAELDYFNGHTVSLYWLFRGLFDVRFDELAKLGGLGIGKEFG